MPDYPPRVPSLIQADSRPELQGYAKLRNDAQRGRWVILAPERILSPDDTALAILRLCDGKRSVSEIGEALALEYDTPAEAIVPDVIEMLQDLADQGIIKA